MKKYKFLLVFLLVLSISCTRKNKIEDIFITSENYYWQFNSECQGAFGHSINFKFDKDGLSHQYGFSVEKSYHSVEGESLAPKKWFIKNDSILSWDDMDYKIEHIDATIIILSRYHPIDKKQKCKISFLKVVDGKLIN
ncbi:hypothetical protein [Flavobacterium sp. N1736]|uniref:hypothetical protein n=1 Tax=Flavobacterium sp. N1736 TaxID=2986823 RepID=UPI0022256C82|nr:hypothetical protein [Flavobacterium sp. N1736]